MNIFKRTPDPYAQHYQTEYNKVYASARMKATVAEAKRNAMARAKADAARKSQGFGVRGSLQRAGGFAQSWAANIEAQEKRGHGLGYGAGLGVYGYGKKRRR